MDVLSSAYKNPTFFICLFKQSFNVDIYNSSKLI